MTTNFLWDFANDSYLMEKDGAGTTTAVYTNEPVPYGNLISQQRGEQGNFYHYDAEGNSRVVTDDNEGTVETATYTAFGEIIGKTSSITNPFGYIGALGYYADVETGRNYVRRRAYDGIVGRWLSLDPIFYDLAVSGSSKLINGFLYASNNPIELFDPSGTFDCPNCCCKVISLAVDPNPVKCVAKTGPPPEKKISFSGDFTITAEFSNEKSYCCGCCSYYQERKGTVKHREVPGGEWENDRQVKTFEEDCEVDETGRRHCYGDRDAKDPRPNDSYEPDRKSGCKYKSSDSPGATNLRPAILKAIKNGRKLQVDIDIEIRLRINDYCCVHPKEKPVFEPLIIPIKCTVTLG